MRKWGYQFGFYPPYFDWRESDTKEMKKLFHCKDWSPKSGKGYKVLLAQGSADWKRIFAAAESVGGLEYCLVEQGGAASRLSELETAHLCLKNFKETPLS